MLIGPVGPVTVLLAPVGPVTCGPVGPVTDAVYCTVPSENTIPDSPAARLLKIMLPAIAAFPYI